VEESKNGRKKKIDRKNRTVMGIFMEWYGMNVCDLSWCDGCDVGLMTYVRSQRDKLSMLKMFSKLLKKPSSLSLFVL